MHTLEPLAVPPAEAARLSGIGRTRIFALIQSGALPSFKVGRSRLIRLEDLRRYVDHAAKAGEVQA